MPRTCTVCTSPKRATFDAVVTSRSRTVRAAAADLGLSYEAAKRHARGHLAPVASAPEEATPLTMTIAETFELASGSPPHPWQRALFEETRNTILLKGRQVGATECAATLAIWTAMSKPGSTSAVISPSMRQSSEVTLRARLGLWAMDQKLRQDSASLLRLANGSRVISLPGHARGIRGYPVDFLCVDEAAWVDDLTFTAARAMTAATRGRIVVQSTPAGESGFFWGLATDTPEAWALMRVTTAESGNVSPEFLATERREMSPGLYAQEYEGSFGNAASAGLLWTQEQWAALVRPPEEAT